jgi:nicotinate (nicotinamide) nucleotide adenylyltransferase
MIEKNKIISFIKKVEKSSGPLLLFLEPFKIHQKHKDLHIGIFTSSYNPPTLAHQEMIVRAYQRFSLDVVIVLFDLINADKKSYPIALYQRIMMALYNFEKYKFTSFAITNQPLFIDKLTLLQQHLPSHSKIYFIIGYDTLIRILNKRYYTSRRASLTTLFSRSQFIVFTRKGYPKIKLPKNIHDKIHFLSLPAKIKDISSTLIREKIKKEQPVQTFLSKDVYIYIRKNNLYTTPKEIYVSTSFIKYRNKILILKRSKKVGSFQGKYAGISGSIDLPEYLKAKKSSIKLCNSFALKQAYCEIQEETNITKDNLILLQKGKVVKIKYLPTGQTFFVFPFLFKLKKYPHKIKLNWENTSYKWIEPHEVLNYPTVPQLPNTLLQFFLPLKLANKLLKIHYDNRSGSMQLAKRLIRILSSTSQTFKNRLLPKIIKNLKPMGAIINIANKIARKISPLNILKEIQKSEKMLIISSRKAIKENEKIIAYSFSSLLLKILKRIKNIEVYLPFEPHSQHLGKLLLKERIKVKFFNATGSLPEASKIIISCDAILYNGDIVNAKGTKQLLKVAKAKKIIVFCFGHKIKKLSKMDSLKVLKNLSDDFEIIPKKYIDKLYLF